MAKSTEGTVGIELGGVIKAGTVLAQPKVQHQVIEIDDSIKTSTIVRGGQEIKAPVANLEKARDLIDKLGPALRPSLPRVLSQTVTPGTFVAKGTVIDIVMVPPKDITLGIFDKIHAGYSDKKMQDVAPLAQRFSDALGKYAKAADVPAADRGQITEALNGIQVHVNDAQPGSTFEDAYNGLQVALAFT